jgi:hypothetical protein
MTVARVRAQMEEANPDHGNNTATSPHLLSSADDHYNQF